MSQIHVQRTGTASKDVHSAGVYVCTGHAVWEANLSNDGGQETKGNIHAVQSCNEVDFVCLINCDLFSFRLLTLVGIRKKPNWPPKSFKKCICC